MLPPEIKKGSAEFLILSLLRYERRHGYELSKLIESRSDGVVQFQVSSLYPLLYRMEGRGWIRGRAEINAYLEQLRNTVSDIHSQARDLHTSDWEETGIVTFVLEQTYKLDGAQQTLEAPSFAASSNIYLKATSSRSKTFLALRAEEPRLSSFLADVRRRVLLGYDASSATVGARPESHVFSESARTVINSVVGVDRAAARAACSGSASSA